MIFTWVFQWKCRLVVPVGFSWGRTETYFVFILYVWPLQMVWHRNNG